MKNVGLDFLNLTGKKAGGYAPIGAQGKSVERTGGLTGPEQNQGVADRIGNINGELTPVHKSDELANKLDMFM